ncbi:Luminal-binding protein 1 (Fragment) [Linum grandiflorum]
MSQTYYTRKPQQTSMGFEVLEGERVLANDCLKLGSFTVAGIPPATRGVATVEVTYEVDVDGILNVTAKNNGTGISQSLTISSYKGNLTSDEVERMIIEAEQMNEDDHKEKARIDSRNQLQGYIYDVKSALDNWDGDKTGVESALTEASAWLDDHENGSKEDYDNRMQILANLWNPIVRSMYGKR